MGFAEPEHQQLDTVLTRPWSTDMRTFRDRCWTNKTELVSLVHTKLTQAMIRGDSPDRVTKAIAEKFNVSKNKAGRLAMTESAYFSAQAQKDCFNNLDVKKYEVVATLDEKTCDICAPLDGMVFPMADYEPGVTANPFHPWCRCCTAPHFEDNDGERAARNADGEVYYVPANMKSPEWKKTFVDGGEKDGLKKIVRNGTIKSIDIDDMQILALGKNVDETVVQTIYDAIKPGEDNGEYFISDVFIGSLRGNGSGTPLLQIEPIQSGKMALLRLNINSDLVAGKTVSEIDDIIRKSSSTVATSLHEAVLHESGHAKLINGLSIKEIESLYNELKNKGLAGLSLIAEKDGAEAIAEIEVLLRRGEKISDDAKSLYEKHMKKEDDFR